jgi:hypothetical protein
MRPAERKITMNSHPYLRAFLAGAFVPTLILPLILTVFIVVRLVLQFPVPIERALVFPMALVPSVFGLWNMFWLASHARTNLPIGLHGALLPLLIAPLGGVVGSCLGVFAFGSSGIILQAFHIPYAFIAFGFMCALAVYYLLWKYIVGFVNHTLGIA